MSRAGPLRVAILGTASSGKSTLAAALAARYNTVWVPEYLREFVDTEARVPAAADQFPIARTQLAREEGAAARANTYLFCDTTPLMTAVYSRHYFLGIDPQLAVLADQHRDHYDLTLVTAPDIPWVPEGLQRECEQVSRIISGLLMEELAARSIPYQMVAGSVDQRVAGVAALLQNLG
ncbi:ATP-binding protein [Rugamonas sp. DEMB1]|uniref:ATP-binding protein n=1 Tax=Rugamonas sp. DEMB1 TaxID=3039386 RepID=UPI002449E5E2|nr:ATP-binding protein [Rugamonas sp. DEMB1]WGG52194.1 ATP-binding protein [Rugamonas sp. DEMB1]